MSRGDSFTRYAMRSHQNTRRSLMIDVATKKTLTALTDETGREVHSEKMVEVHWKGGKVVKTGDQFGVGRAAK